MLSRVDSRKKEYRDISQLMLKPQDWFKGCERELYPEVQLLEKDALGGLSTHSEVPKNGAQLISSATAKKMEDLRREYEEIEGYVFCQILARLGASMIVRSHDALILDDGSFDARGYPRSSEGTELESGPILPKYNINRHL